MKGPDMARPEKVAVVNEVRARLEEASAAVLTEYRGLTVSELAQLRGELRQADATYAVVKNTLARLATREAGLEVPDEVLTGPTAITYCAGDPVATAKVLRRFSREHPELVVKAGILDGRLLDSAETLRLADLESREELLARLAGMFGAMVAQPARLAQASLAKAARLFAALQEKLPAEQPGEAAQATAAEATPAETDETARPAASADEAPAAGADDTEAPASAATDDQG